MIISSSYFVFESVSLPFCLSAFLRLCCIAPGGQFLHANILCHAAGELCQYSYEANTVVSVGTVLEMQTLQETADCRSLCDTRGAQCQAFVYEINTQNCILYSQVVSTVGVNASAVGHKSLSVKRCSYPRGGCAGCTLCVWAGKL